MKEFCLVKKGIINKDECFEHCRRAGRDCEGTEESNALHFESDEARARQEKEDYKINSACEGV